MSIADAISQGMRHHQAGQLAEAERIYRQVLARDPQNAHVLHLLGTVALQVGNLPAAVELLSAAVQLQPRRAEFHANLAEAHRASGNLDEALAGNRQALALQPDNLLAQANLGFTLQQSGDVDAAAGCFENVLRATPNDVDILIALGELERGRGRHCRAEQCFRHVLAVAPHKARASVGLGLTYYQQRRLVEARQAFEAAIAAQPDFVDAHVNLGTVLRELHHPVDAERAYREAVRLHPRLSAAYFGLGALLDQCDRYGDALGCLLQAVKLDPKSADAHSTLARTYLNLDRIDDAIAAALVAIELDPRRASAYCNLGNGYRALGRIDDAISAYRTALHIGPQDPYTYSNAVYTLNLRSRQTPDELFAEHCAWGELLADPLTRLAAAHGNDRSPGRRLRLGYVSAHFCNHAVNFFSEPLLAAHDHQQFELFCYSNGSRHDDANARIQSCADHWREIGPLGDDEAAQLIRDDQIDLLVDLSGHIAGHRLLVFARKPAPVQVTYLGYQNTTGMQAMDYRLTDDWSDPPGTDAFYTEKLLRLPEAFFCYRPSPDAPPVGELPALASGHVTFGSFNNFAKVTPATLDAWAKILAGVLHSRLVILAHNAPSLHESLLNRFAGQGIEPGRVHIVNRCPRPEYLTRIAAVDIALDPFPFNGHTTTCDALWQGVPVITLAGKNYASRFGSSAHNVLGLTEWIAASVEQYVETATALARDLNRLARLRGELRSRMAASTLLDGATFARRVEAAYRAMWIDWCQRPTSAGARGN